jgi:hypothetical protein
MSVGIWRKNITILFWNKEAALFLFWEYINGNQTFILDSHQPFICSAHHKMLFAYLNKHTNVSYNDLVLNLSMIKDEKRYCFCNFLNNNGFLMERMLISTKSVL